MRDISLKCIVHPWERGIAAITLNEQTHRLIETKLKEFGFQDPRQRLKRQTVWKASVNPVSIRGDQYN